MTRYLTLLASILILVFVLTACSAEESAYNKGLKAMEAEDYASAVTYFTEAGEYEDAQAKLEEATHLNDVQNDTTPPTLTGIDEVVPVDCGTSFNLDEYVKENLTITDDVTKDDMDISITCDEKVYERTTGKINTSKFGEFEVTVSASDEAENKGELVFTLQLNPIHVTVDNPNPVIVDNENVTAKLISARHGYFNGQNEYQFIIEVDNRTDVPVETFFDSSQTSINRHQVGAYYIVSPIGAGNIGRAEIMIEDRDIPEDVGVIEQIETKFGITENENDDNMFASVPMIIDIDVIR